MAAKTLKLKYQPRDAFKDFHGRTKRWGVLVCHRRSGKTVACVNELVARALYSKKPRFQGIYLAPFRQQAKDVAWAYLKDYAKEAITKINESELYVELVNGAKIFIRGADNPDGLRGLYIDFIVIDEAADVAENTWQTVIRPALSDRKGAAVFAGSAKGKSNLLYMVFERARKTPEKWFLMVLDAETSGILSDEELADAKENTDPDIYEQEYRSSFDAALKGAYFGVQMAKAAEEKRITTVDVDYDFPVHAALDLGKTDSTAVWMWQSIAGQVRLVNYFEVAGLEIADISARLDETGYPFGTLYLPHDAKAQVLGMAKTRIEQFVDLGWNCRIVTRQNVQDGIEAVRRTLKVCWFDEKRCEIGLECLRNYSRMWNPTTKTFANQPRHDRFSHGADAFRYLSLALGQDESPSDEAIPRKVVVEKHSHLQLYATPLTLDALFSNRPTGRSRSRI